MLLLRMARLEGTRRADAIPCSARAQQSMASVPATPQSADVAERSPEEDEGGERQEIRVDDPLQPRERRAELAAERRQGDVHDRAVEERHPRGERGRDEDAAASRRMQRGSLVDPHAAAEHTRPDDLASAPGRCYVHDRSLEAT